MITEINKDNIEKFLDKEITIRLSPIFEEMEERYGSGCDEEIDAHFRGGIWYREQSKKSKQYYRGIQI